MIYNRKTFFLAQGAIISAIYVVLTLLFTPISFGLLQVRFSEILTILPVFSLSAVPGLFFGCLIGNLVSGAPIIDVILGSMATLIAACATYLLRDKSYIIASIPPVVINAVVVSLILRYAYHIPVPLWFSAMSVGAGELISCTLCGVFFAKVFEKRLNNIFSQGKQSIH